MPRYAVTVIYSADPVIEVEAASIEQAQFEAFKQLNALDIEPDAVDRDGWVRRYRARTDQPVTVAGQTVDLRLASWYAAPMRDAEETRT